MQDFTDVDQSDQNAVVIGLAPDKFNYESMTKAFRLIKEHNAAFIAIHKARYMATPSGLTLGPGKSDRNILEIYDCIIDIFKNFKYFLKFKLWYKL